MNLKRLLVAFFLLSVTVFMGGCAKSAAEKAEDHFLEVYRSYKEQTQSRDSTRNAIRSAYSTLETLNKDRRSNEVEREYNNIAKSGAAGTTEALIAAKKMISNGENESRKFQGSFLIQQEVDSIRERVKMLEEMLISDNLRADLLVPELEKSMYEYEDEYSKDSQRKKQSRELDAALRDTAEIIFDRNLRVRKLESKKSSE